MEPFRAQKLPIEYNIDKDLLSLISEASKKYGEYRSNLKNSKFDSKFFLDSIILSESLKSTQIEGTQISQDEMSEDIEKALEDFAWGGVDYLNRKGEVNWDEKKIN